MVKQILMKKSAAHPLLRKTARGGRKIAMMYANTSDCILGIVRIFLEFGKRITSGI